MWMPITIEATRNDRPYDMLDPCAPPEDRNLNAPKVNSASPNIPNTTLGTLASVSSPTRTMRVIHRRSSMYSAR